MNQLKRKSVVDSPSPDENGDGDAPSKRAKVGDVTGADPEADETRQRYATAADKNDNDRHERSPSPDAFLKQGTISRPSTEAVAMSSSPPRDTRLSESRRHRDSSPHPRASDRDPKPHDSRRRRPSPPMRSPDQDRRPYDARRRGHSPPTRPVRRESESSRRRPQATLSDKDRNRREGLSKEEERKRGKRLFGGLLSTLSQTTTNSQQKRRQEVEKKQQEKAAKQKIEDDRCLLEKLEKLDRIRKIEQVRFDEQVMRTRHSNMLAMAHSLQTRSEPKLYYRPWQPTQDQENIIKNQIRDAEAQIEGELRRFKTRKEQRLKDLGALSSSSKVEATVGELAVEEDRSNIVAQDESAATATNDRRHSPAPVQAPQHISHEERDHDEMVEAEEDTVIY